MDAFSSTLDFWFLFTASDKKLCSLLRPIGFLLANKSASNANLLITANILSVSLHSKNSFVSYASYR